MGACVSSQHKSSSSRADSGSAGRLVKGAAPYDSVASVLANEKSQHSGGTSGGQHMHLEDSGHGSGSSPASRRHSTKRPSRRAPKIDLATGEQIPDFGVHGIFDVLHELGSGGSGQTYLCRDMASRKVVAVKFVPRPLSKAAVPFMMGEVEIQAKLGEGSLNIISLHEIILTRTHLALVMEYGSGGCLTGEVSGLWESALSRGGLFMGEQESSYFMRQFVQAMSYCHKNRVAHRDLKLDNTLLEHQLGGPPRLKLCDFGFAKQWRANESVMHTAIGTPVYMSPQMLAARQCASGYSGDKADIWAAGILLFVMLLGTFPFDHDPKHDPNSSEAAGEVWLKQQQGSWRKHPRAADVLARGVLSADCCELLDRLLEMNEERRISTEELLSHPWLSLPLQPEQQAAWEQLQQEQQQLTRQLEQARDPHLGKLRKDAMLAMMAFAAKAPTASLFPGPNGVYGSPAASSSVTNSSSNVTHGMTLVGASSSATPSLDIAGMSGMLESARNSQPIVNGDVAASPAASSAATSPVGSPAAAAAASPLAAAAASPAGAAALRQHHHKQQLSAAALASLEDTASSPAPPITAAAAEEEEEAAAEEEEAAAAAAVAQDDDGIDTFAVCDGDVMNPPVFENARHFSFQKGEGLRSGSLEEKVDRYRQQATELRSARLAAMITAQQEQQQQHTAGGGAAAAAAGSPAAAAAPHGRRSTDSAGSDSSSSSKGLAGSKDQAVSPIAAGTSGTSAAAHASHKHHRHQGLLGGLKKKEAAATSAAAAAAGTGTPAAPAKKSTTSAASNTSSARSDTHQQQQQQHRRGQTKRKHFLKSPFAAASKAAAAASANGSSNAGGGGGGGDADADDVDEVWRLPLSSTADPSVFKLRPELAVAAGALVRQLQGSGKVPGRGRTNRSSCPM